MKYILLTLLTLFLCFLAGWFIAALLAARGKRHGRAPMPRSRRLLLSFGIGLVLVLAGSLGYLLPYAHAEDSALAYMSGTDTVQVQKMPHGYFFDGPGEETAILFVPGAKVDAKAYAPLLSLLAEGGADCYLYEPPFHMAFSVSGAAHEAMTDCPHAHWYAAGHSLGGVTAAAYAIKNPAAFDGIILLASYPTDTVPDNLSACSIYGDQDTKLDAGAYESHRDNFPADTKEVVLEGGNHAQFGDYGPQSGDSPATISAAEQQRQTVSVILAFLQR